MKTVLKFASLLVMGALLSACAAPGPAIGIRAGVGQDFDLDAIRPPSGATYTYLMEAEGAPVPAELSLTSKRRSGGRYDYSGFMTLTLPQAENLEEIGKIVTQALQLEEAKIRIRGNKLSIPVGLTADNRFRSTTSNLALQKSSYAPHDCFAVIGTCRYVATQGDQTIALVAETSEKDGVWRTKTRPDPAKRKAGQQSGAQSLTYSIDKNAVIIDMVLSQSQGGPRSTVVLRRK